MVLEEEILEKTENHKRRFDVHPFRLPPGARFSNKRIILFLLPVLVEQFMIAGLRIADTSMVSFLGESAVAGVSLVSKIDMLVKQFLLALSTGGSVILSQYIGAKDEKNSEVSLKSNIRIVFAIGCLVLLAMVAFKEQILSFLFGAAEPEVLESSHSYFTMTAFSYAGFALYYAGAAAFRAMGNSSIPFVASVSMMLINLLLKYVFIFHLDLGVTGAGLSTLLSVLLVGIVLLWVLRGKKNKVRLVGLFRPDFHASIAKRILGISLPNGIENAMFQIGVLAIAGLVSTLGTTAIAADALCQSTTPLIYSLGASFNMVMLVLVGQCMGAGAPDEAEKYIKHVLKMDYFFTFINAVILVLCLHPLMSMYQVSGDTKILAMQTVLVYIGFTVLFYPTSFALPAALRGSGDTKFVMISAIASMFLFRIGAAYLFVKVFDMGLLGTWLAMGCDWVIRTMVFMTRFLKKKWKENKAI